MLTEFWVNYPFNMHIFFYLSYAQNTRLNCRKIKFISYNRLSVVVHRNVLFHNTWFVHTKDIQANHLSTEFLSHSCSAYQLHLHTPPPGPPSQEYTHQEKGKKQVKIEIQKLILHCLLYNILSRGYQMHGQTEPRWSGSAITPEAIKS